MSTLHSPTSLHGLHEDSVRTVRTLWTLWGLHDCISYSLHRVHVDSMWTLYGVLMDSSWSPERFPQSSQSPQTMFHGFREDSVRSLQNTVHGVSVDSMRTPCLTYLIKK